MQGAAADAKPAIEATLQGSIEIGSDRFRVLAVTHDDGTPLASPAPTVVASGESVTMVQTGTGHWAATVTMAADMEMPAEALVSGPRSQPKCRHQ